MKINSMRLKIEIFFLIYIIKEYKWNQLKNVEVVVRLKS